jgi:hypothetical protein
VRSGIGVGCSNLETWRKTSRLGLVIEDVVGCLCDLKFKAVR